MIIYLNVLQVVILIFGNFDNCSLNVEQIVGTTKASITRTFEHLQDLLLNFATSNFSVLLSVGQFTVFCEILQMNIADCFKRSKTLL